MTFASPVGTGPEPDSNPDEPVLIGENSQANGLFWNGLIDDVRVYNRALTAAAIAALHRIAKKAG